MEAVGCLTDDRKEGIQRQRRAEHDFLAQRVVDHSRIGLVHEATDALVRQEHEDVVQRLFLGVQGVFTPCQGINVPLHRLDELGLGLLAKRIVVRIEVIGISVEGEFHVHEQHAIGRHVELVVGPTTHRVDVLFRIVHTLDEADGPQHVFDHALAPLAALL